MPLSPSLPLRSVLLLGTLLAAPACAAHKPAAPQAPAGPRHAALDIWRPGEDGTKLYIEADLGDGKPRLFMVDTGASISVLQQEVADELGLQTVEQPGHIVGLGGASRWEEATVESMRLGPYMVKDVDFAVGVPGVPDRAGLAPVAGILGNNIWQWFTLVVDYPANVVELWRPELAPVPAGAAPLHFNGDHVRVEATLQATDPATGKPVRQSLWLEVDTGARELLVSGPVTGPLARVATEGEEPILGVGGGDELPASSFIQRTRRIKVERIEVGGAVIDEDLTARWINYDAEAPLVGPAGMPGLLGHAVVDDYRVIIDYQGRRFAVLPSEREPRPRDVHEWALERLRRPRTAEEVHERTALLAWLDREAEARDELERWLQQHPADHEGAVLLARLVRHQGDPDRALQLLLGRPIEVLVDKGEIVAAVNACWLAGRTEQGLKLAEAAAFTRPEEPDVHVALADARRFTGDSSGARRALNEANRLDENRDGHLLRRAWIATDEGDLYGAITHIRRLMELYPSGGVAPFFYARAVAGGPEQALVREDLSRAQSRLHPGDGPLDFLAAAWRMVGDAEQARRLMESGRQRDCPQAETTEGRDNCEAWYLALGGEKLAEARQLIDAALRADPARSEFLDTQAVVLEAQDELEAARDAAWKAASLSPDDVYLLWQAARLDRRIKERSGASLR